MSIFTVPNELVEKYGHGEVFTETCPTCGFQEELYSSGVHESSGCLKIYSVDDEFECPRCITKQHDSEIHAGTHIHKVLNM